MSALLEARRDEILRWFWLLPPTVQDALIEELAEIECSNDTMEASLTDAGYGSAGII
jgi:hypothetical protein